MEPVHALPGLRARGSPDDLDDRPDRVDKHTRLRKVTRNRGRFPSEQAALKVLCLACAIWRNTATRTPGIRSSGRSRSTSRDESRLHDRSHDHLHRRSGAPFRISGRSALGPFLAGTSSDSMVKRKRSVLLY